MNNRRLLPIGLLYHELVRIEYPLPSTLISASRRVAWSPIPPVKSALFAQSEHWWPHAVSFLVFSVGPSADISGKTGSSKTSSAQSMISYFLPAGGLAARTSSIVLQSLNAPAEIMIASRNKSPLAERGGVGFNLSYNGCFGLWISC